MNGCDYNTMSLKMPCDCSGKGGLLLEREGSERCNSDSGECNYPRTLLPNSSPPHTIDCDLMEMGSVDGTSFPPSLVPQTDFWDLPNRKHFSVALCSQFSVCWEEDGLT